MNKCCIVVKEHYIMSGKSSRKTFRHENLILFKDVLKMKLCTASCHKNKDTNSPMSVAWFACVDVSPFYKVI